MAACQQAGCERPKTAGKHRCLWHWLARQSSEVQAAAAAQRLADAQPPYRNRVAADQWPAGERFCAGCQSFIPDIYVRGSRCRSCASTATHASRVKAVYGITGQQYDQLLEAQGGRCALCGRQVHSKRLAVDHNHQTGEVRALLCPGDQWCNAAIVGGIEAASSVLPGGALEYAQRLVAYFTEPPARAVLRPEDWDPFK